MMDNEDVDTTTSDDAADSIEQPAGMEGGEDTGEKAPLSRRRFIALAALGLVAVGVVGTAALVSVFTRGDGQPEPAPAPEPEPADPAASKPVKVDDDKTPKAPGATDANSAKGDAGGEGDAPGAEGGDAGTAEGGGGAEGAGSAGDASGTGGSGTGSGSSGGAGTGSGGSGGTGGTGSGGGGAGGRVWHEGWSEWVVDVPAHSEYQLVSAAWDEETGHYGAACNVCGAELYGTHENYLDHAKATGHIQGYTTGVWFSSGTIHHDAVYGDVWVEEQGHWVLHEGYWE